ncbi:MAG: hypothetical protein NXY57DRAFT_1041659 [Lentinula lateritia]|nr:MAG: hypothetical protein NXY57DRAFT_1041659 [Lentinula lateritia]
MGTDLGLFLSIFYGAATDGDTLSFSIGQGENSILGILPQSGLTGSHNNCEEDVSPTRGDLHEYVVAPASYPFIFRFMANKSEEYPERRLDGTVSKSFLAITGPENNLIYTSGYERIPDNWYKRAIGDE